MRRSALLLPLLALLLPGSAGAQSALRGHDTNQPVDFAADRIEVQDRADRAVLVGNVEARQGSLRLNAPRVTVAYSTTGGVDVTRLDASGGVTIRSPSETARGNFGIYDLDRRLITLVGNVTLSRGADVLRGGRLVLDLTSGRATLDGSGSGGRVTGRFTVPQRAN